MRGVNPERGIITSASLPAPVTHADLRHDRKLNQLELTDCVRKGVRKAIGAWTR